MTDDHAAIRRSTGFSLFLTLVWVAAAAIRPTATYHLAPVLAAGAAPVGYVTMVDRAERGLGLALAAMATMLVSGVAFLLAAAGMLEGPSLLPIGGALLESLVFALFSGIVSAAVVLRRVRAAADH